MTYGATMTNSQENDTTTKYIRPSKKQLTLAYDLIEFWRERLNLRHWRFVIIDALPKNPKHAATITHRRKQNLAEIRVANVTWKLPRKEFEQVIIHELCHTIIDAARQEQFLQTMFLRTRKKKEYRLRFETELERTVEHLALVLYSMQYERR